MDFLNAKKYYIKGGNALSDAQKSVVRGMTVLGLAGFICKVVGALYRIPLAWIIGESGIGMYQLVFPTYNLLLTVSASGIPVAISRMVSYSLAKDDPRTAKRVLRIALVLLAILGSLGMLLMILFSYQLAGRIGDPLTQMGFVAIAPALLMVCVMSAFRGFLQGQQNMVPTAVSQLIEQVGKVVIILPMAYVGMRVSVSHAAAMVLWGNTLAEGVALLYMLIIYSKGRREYSARRQAEELSLPPTKALVQRLLSLSIPITLGGCIIPLASFVDSGMLLNRLMDAGFALEEGRALYGRYSGYVISLINVPTALAIAIAMSLVPAISGAMARGNGKQVRRQSALGIRFAFLVGLPASVGMSMLSEPILAMLYRFPSSQALRTTAELLSISSFTIVLFTVVQATSGILQGLRKQRIPMYTLLAGVAVKVGLNYVLVGIPQVNIYGAPIASLACYTISMIPNLFYSCHYTGMKFDFMGALVKPGLATVGMAGILWVGRRVLHGSGLSTCLLIILAVASYVGFAFFTGALTREDLVMFTKRRRNRNIPTGRENQ